MGEPNKCPDTVTQTAEYCCMIFQDHGWWPICETRPVTVKVVPNENEFRTEDRFQRASEIELYGIQLRKDINRCKDNRIFFAKFLPTFQETHDVVPIKPVEPLHEIATKEPIETPAPAYICTVHEKSFVYRLLGKIFGEKIEETWALEQPPASPNEDPMKVAWRHYWRCDRLESLSSGLVYER